MMEREGVGEGKEGVGRTEGAPPIGLAPGTAIVPRPLPLRGAVLLFIRLALKAKTPAGPAGNGSSSSSLSLSALVIRLHTPSSQSHDPRQQAHRAKVKAF